VSSFGYVVDNLRKLGRWLRSSPHVRFFLNRALWETGFPWTHLYPAPLEAIFPGIDRMLEPVQIVHPVDARHVNGAGGGRRRGQHRPVPQGHA
jgi:hypothetical protein